MKRISSAFVIAFTLASASAEVRVFVTQFDGLAWIKYQCTAGETVRAFCIDVSVDRGRIAGISDFFRGESTPVHTGYGIFPASFRDHIAVTPGASVDWEVSGYTPVASVADAPGDTLPGLDSTGVTLEFGALWDAQHGEAAPARSGTLCALHLSEPANVSLAANGTRGGIVSALSDVLTPVLIGAPPGPAITSTRLSAGMITITFSGGQLETATTPDGEWTDTDNTSGEYIESVETNTSRFFRVRAP